MKLMKEFAARLFSKEERLLVCFILSFCTCTGSFAQNGIHRLGKPYIYRDSTMIGNANIEVIYRHRYNDRSNGQELWSNIRMQVGENFSYQINLHTHLCNLSLTNYDEKQPPRYDIIDREGITNPTYFSSILSDKKTATLEVITCDYLLSRSDSPWRYTEPVPEQKWVLYPDESREIAGYKCFRAATDFRGRKWNVWYAPDLPFNAGPWKLSGLPGLILEAEDADNCYSFTCIELRNISDTAFRYNPMASKQTTREKYLRYERNYHADPRIAMDESKKTYFFMDGHVNEMETDITVPYDPIELE